MIYAYYILNKLDWYEYKQSVLFLKTKIQANIRLSMIKAKRANLDQILVKKVYFPLWKHHIAFCMSLLKVTVNI